jgi:hypothetical protein
MNNELYLSYYNFINDNISLNDINKAGVTSCVDVTMQTLVNHFEYLSDIQLYKAFVNCFENKLQRKLTEDEGFETDKIILAHCAMYQ